MPFVTSSKLFEPIKIGHMELKHHIVLAPLTRLRNDNNFVPLDVACDHYAQRASVPGTLLITEAMGVFPKGGAYFNIPGVWKEEQIVKWKKVTDCVHLRDGFIFAQIWSGGRIAIPDVLKSQDPSYIVVGPSDIPCNGHDWPVHPLTAEEIKEYVEAWSKGAANAVHKAGFDGVELHFANGYLPDQFLQDVSNKRTDEYGGSIENRARFPLEIVEGVVKEVGQERVGVRLSPWSTFQGMNKTGMRMKDPKPTFTYVVEKLKELYPNLGYLSVIEPRIAGDSTVDLDASGESNDFLREIWAPKPLISAGGYARESAMKTADEKGDVIAFGRMFISNPDLPFRLLHDIPLTKYDRSLFYCPGDNSGKGYTDYPFSEEFSKTQYNVPA
ncbi:NADH:flavin oxidoreductase/NADH oxidase [Dendrothele bispora CBS 962.96]|uniref:NADH:flavin oxidoreductase/NADH oxidase n=1 Tax=Dendrothele bispora (strain CBS 962.96) TaxID=1314807 RepID=A0A4S8ML38_DENBC|nr:NADH:flavin oxidoreductase/NADH oxidase [Dendrothele bispora CBS 962.96]